MCFPVDSLLGYRRLPIYYTQIWLDMLSVTLLYKLYIDFVKISRTTSLLESENIIYYREKHMLLGFVARTMKRKLEWGILNMLPLPVPQWDHRLYEWGIKFAAHLTQVYHYCCTDYEWTVWIKSSIIVQVNLYLHCRYSSIFRGVNAFIRELTAWRCQEVRGGRGRKWHATKVPS